MRVVLIGAPKSFNTLELTRAWEDQGHTVSAHRLATLQIHSDADGTKVFAGTEVIDGADIYMFGAYNRNFWYAQVLAKHFAESGATIIDSVLTDHLVPSKLYETTVFRRGSIPHPNTVYVASPNEIESALERVNYPLILKPVYGEQGNGLYLANSAEELPQEFLESPKQFIVQEQEQITSDIRVFVIGGKAIAASERHLIPGDFRTNASLGAKVTKFELNDEVRELAERAAQAIGYDLAGVDVLCGTDGTYKVVEVNCTPQWKTLEEQNGIDVAAQIVEYVISKHEKSRVL